MAFGFRNLRTRAIRSPLPVERFLNETHSETRKRLFAILSFVIVVSLLDAGCTPALLNALPPWKFRFVNATTGEPVPGVAVLITWNVCRIWAGGWRPVNSWDYVSDAKGE